MEFKSFPKTTNFMNVYACFITQSQYIATVRLINKISTQIWIPIKKIIICMQILKSKLSDTFNTETNILCHTKNNNFLISGSYRTHNTDFKYVLQT